ncbi:MAG: hypothetical protein GY780_02975 [bacterium]|nr:hypothetical protein [bacterium]
MYNKIAGILFIVSIVGLTLVSCNKEQKPATNDDLCRTVFEALQNNNVELFSSLLITDDIFQGMINSLDESVPKEKSIKSEFISDFNVEKVTNESLASFNKLVSQGQDKTVDLKNAVYSGVIFKQTRYEAGNHVCKKLKFKMIEGESFYSVIVYFFQTDDGMFIYDELKVNDLPNF